MVLYIFCIRDGGVLSVACSTSFGHCLVIFIITHSRICILLFGAFVMNVYRYVCVSVCVRWFNDHVFVCVAAVVVAAAATAHYQQLHIEFIYPSMHAHSDFDSLHTINTHTHTHRFLFMLVNTHHKACTKLVCVQD